MERAKAWNVAVEDTYRFQCSGWRDAVEYVAVNQTEPERWPESQLVKKLVVKGSGTWNYFSVKRECLDKDLPKVKLYAY
eukprot:EC713096.1.p2 GENE.EC713096.1~~EC713096.1.p2  ORF type:complete len:92 (+),score=8.77 EC713096.1:41-277(+)